MDGAVTMCGIAGIVNLGGAYEPQSTVLAMCEAMRHRGPDNTGLDLGGHVILGHTRLSINDFSKEGNQPFYGDGGDIVACINGEIYNHLELQADLANGGRELVSRSDCEVVPHLYAKFGIDFIERLQGMFAIALHDKKRKRLYLIRDRFGEKPLYYHRSKTHIAFSSEVKPLFHVVDGEPSLDRNGVFAYLTLRYVPAPLTIVSGISKLRPGHFLEVDTISGQVVEHRYYDMISTTRSTGATARQLSTVRGVVEEAIKSRLMSDAPLGLLLSGGVDSSIVAGVTHKHMPTNLTCYTLDFPQPDGQPSSDAIFATRTAAELGYRHRLLRVDDYDVERLFMQLYGDMDEPDPNLSCFATYVIANEAHSDGIKVLLSGDSADEAFLGYRRYLKHFLKGHRALFGLESEATLAEGYVSERGSRFDRTVLVHSAFEGALEKVNALAYYWCRGTVRGRERAHINAYPYLDLMMWVADMCNMRTDKLGMRFSVEIRAPFLDSRVQEMAWRLPFYKCIKFHGIPPRLQGKAPLREAFSEVIPAYIRNQPKSGFSTPIVPWFQHTARNLILELTSAQALNELGVFKSHETEKLILDTLNNESADYMETAFFQSVVALSAWAHENGVKGLSVN